MRDRFILILSVLFLSVFALAQETPRFEEKVEVRLIDLEVFVSDRAGNRVSGLTADDFVVREDGIRREITNFSEVRHQDLGGDAVMETRAGSSLAKRPPRTLILFIDYIPTTPPERKELFTQIRDFAEKALQPGDRATVVHWKFPAEVMVELTTDRQLVTAALEELANTSVPPEATYGLDVLEQFHEEAEEFYENVMNSVGRLPGAGATERWEMPDDAPMSAETQSAISLRACAQRFQDELKWKTTAMRNMITSVSGIEGRKAFVYVGSRFPQNAATHCLVTRRAGGLEAELAQYDNSSMIEAVTEAANAAEVSFYALRPLLRRSPGSAENKLINEGGTSEVANEQLELLNDSRAMGTLAKETGGLFASGARIFETLPRVLDDLDSYYSIAYRTEFEGSDREHEIDVRVPDRNLDVRVRRTLVEKSPKSQTEDWLIANLFAASRGGELETVLVPGEIRKENGRSILPLELKIPLDQLVFAGDPAKARFTVLSVSGSSLGVVTPVHEDTRELDRPEADQGVSPYVTYELEMLMDDRERRISIALFDPSSGYASFHVIDQDGNAMLDRESLEPSWTEWRALLDRMRPSRRPILVYLRTSDCVQGACAEFEAGTLAHPEITKRMASVEFSPWQLERGVPPSVWPSTTYGLALLRDDGAPITRWSELPEPMVLASVLDRIAGATALIHKSGRLADQGKEEEAAIESAWVAMHLGRPDEARRHLGDLSRSGSDVEIRSMAGVMVAFLDMIEGAEGAEARLEALGSTAETPQARAEAWMAVAAARGARLDRGGRITALRNVLEHAPKNSPHWVAARQGLGALDALDSRGRAVRLIPLAEEVVSGPMQIQADVTSDEVREVEFFLDGSAVGTAGRSPYEIRMDLGRLPEPHTVRVVARDGAGRILGEDSMRLNDWRDLFRVKIVNPKEGVAQGQVPVEVEVLAPVKRRVERVEVLSGSDRIARLTSAPYQTVLDVSPRPTIVSARAYLDDGRFAEDTVLLNAEGYAAEADVRLIELPVTVSTHDRLSPSDIVLREDGSPRSVETILQAADSPLTVGLVIDNSASMWERYLDVQAAASEFLDRVLSPGDRAFVVSFDSFARLVQEPTSDRELLKDRLRSVQPQGLTVMNDAMMLGLLQFAATPGRRALVVFSDGVDKGSRHELEQVIELARRTAIPIYLIRAETEELTSIPNDERFARERYERQLASLIDGSGGEAYMLEGSEGLLSAYREIADDINRQILVTYLTEGRPGPLEWREIELRSNRRGVSLRAPRGFFVGNR